jgi:hypothetical protein
MLLGSIITMKNDIQKMLMYIALGATIATLVLYMSGQLKFVEFLESEEGEESDDEGVEGYKSGEPRGMGESDSDSDSDSEE